eukprot:gene4674-33951_t
MRKSLEHAVVLFAASIILLAAAVSTAPHIHTVPERNVRSKNGKGVSGKGGKGGSVVSYGPTGKGGKGGTKGGKGGKHGGTVVPDGACVFCGRSNAVGSNGAKVKLASLTFAWTSADLLTSSAVSVSGGPTATITDTELVIASGSKFPANTIITVDDTSLAYHTSCSKPLYVGQTLEFSSGTLTVSKFTTTAGVSESECPSVTTPAPTPPPPTCYVVDPSECNLPLCTICDKGVGRKLNQITFRLDGGDATVSNSQQGKGTASGDTVSSTSEVVCNGGPAVNVAIGGTASFSVSGADTRCTVTEAGPGSGPVQELKIHTSCSKALNLGDRFGAVVVAGFVSNTGETEADVCGGTCPPCAGTPPPTPPPCYAADPAAECSPCQACGQSGSAGKGMGGNGHSRLAQLTLALVGGPATLSNLQGGKAFATGDVVSQAALVSCNGGTAKLVMIGGLVQLDWFRGAETTCTMVELSATNPNRQTIAIHTSCSRDLSRYDQFGALQVVGFVLGNGESDVDQCGAAFTPKANPSTIACPLTTAGCIDLTCCDIAYSCSDVLGPFGTAAFVCAANTVAKPNQGDIACSATGCSQLECCESASTSCATFVCAVPLTLIPGPPTCAGPSATCDATTCCEDVYGRTCADTNGLDAGVLPHVCSANWQAKANPSTLSCPLTGCVDATCCVPDSNCGTNWDAVSGVAFPGCGGFNSGGFIRADAADITCATVPCTAAECCIDCDQASGVQGLRDRDRTQTNSDGTPSSFPERSGELGGLSPALKSGSYTHPFYVGTRAQCDNYVAGLNDLAGLTGANKIQCVEWSTDNTVTPSLSAEPVTVVSVEDEVRYQHGFALAVPGGAGVEASDTTNCNVAKTNLDALLSPVKILEVAGVDTTVQPVVLCEPEFCPTRTAVSVTLTAAGSGYTPGLAVATTTVGTGSFLTVDITASGGVVTAVSVNSVGHGYAVNDVITIDQGGIDATFTIDAYAAADCIVRLTSPIYDRAAEGGTGDSEFFANTAWSQQLNNLVFAHYCGTPGTDPNICTTAEQIEFESRSCNSPRGIQEQDCAISIFKGGLGPRPSATPWPDAAGSISKANFVARGDVGQSKATWADYQLSGYPDMRKGQIMQSSSRDGGFTWANADDDDASAGDERIRIAGYNDYVESEYAEWVDTFDYNECLENPFCNTLNQKEGRGEWSRADLTLFFDDVKQFPAQWTASFHATSFLSGGTGNAVDRHASTGGYTRNTPCFPYQMNGLDAWDDLCFGTVRTRYTNDGYLVDYATAAVVAYSLSSGGSDAAPWTESGSLFQSVFKRNSATSINKPTNYVVGPLAQYVRVVKDMSDLLNFPSGKVVFVDWWIPEAGSSSTWHYFAHEPQQWYNLAEDTGATANPDFAFVDEAGAAAVQVEFHADATAGSLAKFRMHPNTGTGSDIALSVGMCTTWWLNTGLTTWDVFETAACNTPPNIYDLTSGNVWERVNVETANEFSQFAVSDVSATGQSLNDALHYVRAYRTATTVEFDYWVRTGLRTWDIYESMPQHHDLAAAGSYTDGANTFTFEATDFGDGFGLATYRRMDATNTAVDFWIRDKFDPLKWDVYTYKPLEFQLDTSLATWTRVNAGITTPTISMISVASCYHDGTNSFEKVVGSLYRYDVFPNTDCSGIANNEAWIHPGTGILTVGSSGTSSSSWTYTPSLDPSGTTATTPITGWNPRSDSVTYDGASTLTFSDLSTLQPTSGLALSVVGRSDHATMDEDTGMLTVVGTAREFLPGVGKVPSYSDPQSRSPLAIAVGGTFPAGTATHKAIMNSAAHNSKPFEITVYKIDAADTLTKSTLTPAVPPVLATETTLNRATLSNPTTNPTLTPTVGFLSGVVLTSPKTTLTGASKMCDGTNNMQILPDGPTALDGSPDLGTTCAASQSVGAEMFGFASSEGFKKYAMDVKDEGWDMACVRPEGDEQEDFQTAKSATTVRYKHNANGLADGVYPSTLPERTTAFDASTTADTESDQAKDYDSVCGRAKESHVTTCLPPSANNAANAVGTTGRKTRCTCSRSLPYFSTGLYPLCEDSFAAVSSPSGDILFEGSRHRAAGGTGANICGGPPEQNRQVNRRRRRDDEEEKATLERLLLEEESYGHVEYEEY